MIKTLLLKYLTFFSGCIGCFILHTVFAVPAVLASALVGLIGAFIPFPKIYGNNPNAAIYAGSFAGMCSIELIDNYWELAIISLLGSALFVFTINHLHGFGGKLGSVAFASVGLYILAKGVTL